MENSNGFSSPRNDAFNPAGLRVLVVDDDPTWLKILEKMLKKCSYEVTTCGLARDALNLLRERKDGFDIVISDVYMPDMDGFKLLEHVGLEMDLPVIMMSVDGETSRVMKGVQHGACDYLLKPIRMKELRNIWQHVFRKKIHEVRDIEILEGIESFQMTRNGSDQSDDGHFLCGEDTTSAKKRKGIENKHDEKEHIDGSTKKARVVWSVGLHQKFVNAVNQIGLDKVGPKKILDLMNVPWLTRENVASHLQKYRLYLSRLQKENDLKTCGVKHSDSPSRDSPGSFGIQHAQQNDVPKGSFVISGKSLLNQNANSRNHEDDGKRLFSVPVAEPKRSLAVDIPHSGRPKSSHMEFFQSFSSPNTEVTFAAYDPSFSQQYPWNRIADVQMKQELKPLHLGDGSSQLPFSSQQLHMQADCPQPAASISSGTIKERGVVGPSRVKRSYDEFTSTTNQKVVEPISADKFSIGSQGVSLHGIKEPEISKTNMNLGISPSNPLDEDFEVCWVPGDCYPMNLEIQSTIEYPQYFGAGLIADVPVQPNDAWRSDYDILYDPTEYSLIDQGLFIA